MENKSLYSITTEQLELINEIEILEGEITPEMEQRLQITKEQLEFKSISYLEVIAKKDAFNTLIDNEIKRLQALKKQNNNVIERLKDNLLMAVKTFGAFQVGTNKFGSRKSTSVFVEEDKINSLPKKYKTIKVTESPDKKAIGEALKAGKKINGCRLIENQNLKIN